MIFAHPYTTIFGMEFTSYLAEDDIAGDYGLPTKFFEPEPSTS